MDVTDSSSEGKKAHAKTPRRRGGQKNPTIPWRPLREISDAIFRAGVHAGRGASAHGNVIARSVVCDCASILQDEAISFVDEEIASQTMS
jgi:hypothetical protein